MPARSESRCVRFRRGGVAVALAGLCILINTMPPQVARADEDHGADSQAAVTVAPLPSPVTPPTAAQKRRSVWRMIGLGSTGILTAYVAHEMGHLFTNFLYGNVPTLEPVTYAGFFPFFTIDPGIDCDGSICRDRHGDRFRRGRRANYFITSAGFNVHHLTNELILSLDPQIRYHKKPFLKGMMLFNAALSTGYALSNWFRLEPPTGDVQGMARASGVQRDLMGAFMLLPTALDLMRFLYPEIKWLPWISRGSKATFIGVGFAI